jgi:hypothetical protein
MFVIKLCSALNHRKISYAIVGGYAVALHGAVRGTIDIDLILKWDIATLRKAEAAMKDLNLLSRVPVTAKDIFDFRNEYIEKRNLIAWNFYNPSNPAEQVDIIITEDVRGRKIKKINIKGTTINILELDDLIKIKKRAGRPQDLEDIKALEKLKK